MTDEELRASWPELGALVQYASTSGEIYNGVGNALWQNKAVRKSTERTACQDQCAGS